LFISPYFVISVVCAVPNFYIQQFVNKERINFNCYHSQRCQPWDFIPRSWDFLKRLGYFWDFILRNETLGFFLGFFLGFLRNSQEK
jgi:hypothetical protein